MNPLLFPTLAPFTFAFGLMLGVLVLAGALAVLGVPVARPGRSRDVAGLRANFDLTAQTPLDMPALLLASTALDHVPAAKTGLLARIGLGDVPVPIALAGVLFSFGLGGYFLQLMAMSFGPALSPWVAVPIALFGAVRFGRGFAITFARLIPGVATTDASAQSMGGLRGTVTGGTARKGHPAEVCLRDNSGTLHHLCCEPFRAKDIIPQGTQVLALRQRIGRDQWLMRIVAIP